MWFYYCNSMTTNARLEYCNVFNKLLFSLANYNPILRLPNWAEHSKNLTVYRQREVNLTLGILYMQFGQFAEQSGQNKFYKQTNKHKINKLGNLSTLRSKISVTLYDLELSTNNL